METEEQLLQHICQGDRGAQRRLYERFAPMAMAQAMRYVADRQAACDVLQESFVKILTAVRSFEYRGEGGLRRWVMSIVSHEAVNWLRERSKYEMRGNGGMVARGYDDSIADDPPDEEPDVGSVPMDTLQHMIEQLPEGYRTVFCLYVFDEMSHKEIARTLGIKENSSASQFLRAKRLLAKMIKNYQQQQQ